MFDGHELFINHLNSLKMNLDILSNPDIQGTVKFEITASDLLAVIDNAVNKAKEAFAKEADQIANDEFIPRKEAMEILNVKTVLTMIRWEKKEYLTPYRMSSRIFYKKSEVLAAVEQFKRMED